MTRRLDFNIFSLGGIALAITIIVSLFAGITAHNPPSSDSPYSLNLERSSSGSYLNLLVAESEEDTSLKIRTDKYTIPTTPAPAAPPQSESESESESKFESASESPQTHSVTVHPPSPAVAPEAPETPEPSPTSEATPEPSPSPSPEPDSGPDVESLISEFNSFDKKISALLDQLNAALDRLYPEKIIYQPELDVLYPALTELSQLITLESDFLADHFDDLPDFYHKRHDSNLSAFSALRDRLDYLLKNLKPLSEDINTYSYASLCKSLPKPSYPESSRDSSSSDSKETSDTSADSAPSTSQEDSELPTDSVPSDLQENSDPSVESSPTPAESSPSEESAPSDSPSASDSTDSEQTDIPLDGFGLPICSSASYVAEKASEFYSLSLSDWGSPDSWHKSAASLGYTVDNTPSAHSIGIDLSSNSPHFIWVESLSRPSASPTPSATPTPTAAPTSTPAVTPTSTPTASPILVPSPTASALPVSSVLINLSEYDSILTPLDFSYRTNVSASPYIFIHLDQPTPTPESSTDDPVSPENSEGSETPEDLQPSESPEPDDPSSN